jgi:hypothetical protein
MIGRIFRFALAASLAFAAAASPAAAQPTVRVGPVRAENDCRVYVSCWGWWMLVICQNNFVPMRARLRSALAESGRLSAADGARFDYELTGRITELGLVSNRMSGRDFEVNSTRAVATLDVALRHVASGRVVYAGTVTSAVDAGMDISTDGSSFSNEASARAVYNALQREIALAAARGVAFSLDPLRVTEVQGPRRVRLNYGSPLLELDTNVQVADASGTPVPYRVTAVMPGFAVAEAQIDTRVAAGAPASVVEQGAGGGQMNRFPRVELPRN